MNKSIFKILFLVFIVGTFVIGRSQWCELATLRSEKSQLAVARQSQSSTSVSQREPRMSGVRRSSMALSKARIAIEKLSLLGKVNSKVQLTADDILRYRTEKAELLEHLPDLLLEMNYDDLEQLFQTLDQHSEENRAGVVTGIVLKLLNSSDPGKAVQFHLNRKALPESGEKAAISFHNWVLRSPNEALQWFYELGLSGHSFSKRPEVVRYAILAQVRLDPSAALGMCLEKSVPPDSLASLGAHVVPSLIDHQEHQAFLAALDDELAKAPALPLLEKIRREYLSELGGRLYGWRIEDATDLLERLRPDETDVLLKNVFSGGDLPARNDWADWTLKTFPEVVEWHPLEGLMTSWTINDPSGAGSWLQTMSPGRLKEQVIKTHAWFLCETDFPKALALAEKLPTNKEREELIQKIRRKVGK